MRNNPERLAWTVLLLSFFACVCLAIGTPLSIRYYVLHARVPQSVTLEVQQGPLRAMLSGRGVFVSIPEARSDIRERTIVATDSTLGRLVLRTPRADGPILATVQLYEHTEVILSTARSPRYPASRLPHQITLNLKAGLVRIRVFDEGNRPTIVTVQTPHGFATLLAGNYAIKVSGTQTDVTAYAGQADLSKGEWAARLQSAEQPEYATMDKERIIGPVLLTSNLIANGDFAAPLEGIWNVYNRVDNPDESEGNAQTALIEGVLATVFTRRGANHAETGITQTLNADISGFRSLHLHILLRVEEQDVPVCGSLGSECPVMVRLEYVDANGSDNQWLQGFYALSDPNIPGNPTVCVTCSTRREHIRVPWNGWYAYLSSNLIPEFSQNGQGPRLIKSIAVYSSGHTYRAAVAEVELIGQ